MNRQSGVSRRGFVKGVAGTAAVPGAIAGISAGSARAESAVSVVATVVRTSHSRTEPQALRIGVRTSIQGPAGTLDGAVLVVEPVPFGASPKEIMARITESVRAEVVRRLAGRGTTVTTDDIAVQVFGGPL